MDQYSYGQTGETFVEQQYAISREVPTALASGDFNGDGLPEIAIAETNGIQIYNGQPNGVITADFNGDGAFQISELLSVWTALSQMTIANLHVQTASRGAPDIVQTVAAISSGT